MEEFTILPGIIALPLCSFQGHDEKIKTPDQQNSAIHGVYMINNL